MTRLTEEELVTLRHCSRGNPYSATLAGSDLRRLLAEVDELRRERDEHKSYADRLIDVIARETDAVGISVSTTPEQRVAQACIALDRARADVARLTAEPAAARATTVEAVTQVRRSNPKDHCTYCGMSGHYKRICDERDADADRAWANGILSDLTPGQSRELERAVAAAIRARTGR